MKINRMLLLAAGLGLGSFCLGWTGALAPSASAMPIAGLGSAAQADAPAGVEKARWICGPYRCRWVPGWRRYWGPRPYWRRPYYGYYRPWWGWRRPFYW
ncbi:hypothetical protein [Methylocapsa acidiphila]|uniref:hypothetical protein n=1 Tax=Methylocapsa acidiphila TaxID=133552 RepID=UPI00042A028F|nr:hypothetical protein [Methylocapsa acidiphila]